MMTAEKNTTLSDTLVAEFELWQKESNEDTIFLLEVFPTTEDAIKLKFLLACEHEFSITVPKEYPNSEDFLYIEAEPIIKDWCSTLNQYLLDDGHRHSLPDVLHKCVYEYERFSQSTFRKQDVQTDEEYSDEENSDDDLQGLSVGDDGAFTTEWDLEISRMKKKWALKEKEIRLSRQVEKPAEGDQAGASKNPQIFTSTAAAGILTNDLVSIMEKGKEQGFTAEPIQDNIYHWRVTIFNFEESGLARDLEQIEQKFGYNYIELEMMFEIDLYPFYPPLVKVLRPRLQGSMMQRVTNMEMLKLSYWCPTKDMKSIIQEIKTFLQQWARLEVDSERNDMQRYQHGAYLEMEHHLLTLALVSEVVPRVNLKYSLTEDKMTELRVNCSATGKRPGNEEYWAKGVGFGHHNRPAWDINAYIAAVKEKDKKIEDVLKNILRELKTLYANHAPQLKLGNLRSQDNTSANVLDTGQCVDPVQDMYHVIEGSALIPFLEQNLKAESYLEICRHSLVYQLIADIIKEIARQKALLPLLCSLPNQHTSIYTLLEQMEAKSSILLKHTSKAGNGSVPKPSPPLLVEKDPDLIGLDSLLPGCFGRCRGMSSHYSTSSLEAAEMAEEKLAREYVILFNNIKDVLQRNCLSPDDCSGAGSHASVVDLSSDGTSVLDIQMDTLNPLDVTYKQILQPLQLRSTSIAVEGAYAHHYANKFKIVHSTRQTQVFRIAQELSSLSTSLPLNLSSSIFIRTDDDKLTLMKALITGPEGTPYSGGCFVFDIYFDPHYPLTPPLVNLQTTGGGKVRFNPNLYACGKVCLSLLGTWHGQQGEQWNEKTSTLLQVLISIQSLILVPDPYFNEPGFETQIGTDQGQNASDAYNAECSYDTVKYAILGQLQNPTPEFADAIKAHFYVKKQQILEEVESWSKKYSQKRFQSLLSSLKQEMKKLPPVAANSASKM